MMMKKTWMIFAAGLCALCLSACQEDTRSVPFTEEAPAEENVAVGDEAAPEETMFGLPNPMVPVTDPAEFEMVLGIPIEPSALSLETECFIISGQMADVRWHRDNGNGEDTELCLRATKNGDLAPYMHGIYDDHMSEPVVTHTEEADVTFTDALTEKIGICTWSSGDTFYSLTYDMGLSQMSLAAVLDTCMMATGRKRIPEIVMPIASIPQQADSPDASQPVSDPPAQQKATTDAAQPDSDTSAQQTSTPTQQTPQATAALKLPDGTYAAEFSPEDFREEDGKWELEAGIFTPEYFDLVDVTMMVPGDILVIGGEEIPVESVELSTASGSPVLFVNGGLEAGGIDLCEGGDGTYRMQGVNDMTSYTPHGTAVLPVSAEVKIRDLSNPRSKKTNEVSTPKKVRAYLTTNDLMITRHSASVTLKDGELTEIEIRYVP